MLKCKESKSKNKSPNKGFFNTQYLNVKIMLKLISLFAYINYFTSPQIRRFKPLCYNMDTLYLFQKIMQYRPPYTPPTPRYRPPLPTPYRSQTPPMMMFAKFFWEIFLSVILDPFFKNFFLGIFWVQNTTTPFSKIFFWEFFCPIFLKYLY